MECFHCKNRGVGKSMLCKEHLILFEIPESLHQKIAPVICIYNEALREQNQKNSEKLK